MLSGAIPSMETIRNRPNSPCIARASLASRVSGMDNASMIGRAEMASLTVSLTKLRRTCCAFRTRHFLVSASQHGHDDVELNQSRGSCEGSISTHAATDLDSVRSMGTKNRQTPNLRRMAKDERDCRARGFSRDSSRAQAW